MAFCATAPGIRPSFFAVWGPDNFALVKLRKFLTSSFVHAFINRLCRFAAIVSFEHECVIPSRLDERYDLLKKAMTNRMQELHSAIPLKARRAGGAGRLRHAGTFQSRRGRRHGLTSTSKS